MWNGQWEQDKIKFIRERFCPLFVHIQFLYFCVDENKKAGNLADASLILVSKARPTALTRGRNSIHKNPNKDD
jgi:hypothetical protein